MKLYRRERQGRREGTEGTIGTLRSLGDLCGYWHLANGRTIAKSETGRLIFLPLIFLSYQSMF
jgi:hypothetical protein